MVQAKPNIVFILSDDHGAWALGCRGNREIRTPNLDDLAQPRLGDILVQPVEAFQVDLVDDLAVQHRVGRAGRSDV